MEDTRRVLHRGIPDVITRSEIIKLRNKAWILQIGTIVVPPMKCVPVSINKGILSLIDENPVLTKGLHSSYSNNLKIMT